MHDAPGPLVERQLAGIQEWEDIEQRRITDADLPATTRTALVKARVGQGLFKERVSHIERACRITFVDNPAHLIGSHIKPWRECSNDERLEGTNGLLLTPSADHLFDRGFISFDDNGELLVSRVADVRSLQRMGVDPDLPPHRCLQLRPTAFPGLSSEGDFSWRRVSRTRGRATYKQRELGGCPHNWRHARYRAPTLSSPHVAAFAPVEMGANPSAFFLNLP